MKVPKVIPIGGFEIPVVLTNLVIREGATGAAAFRPIRNIEIEKDNAADLKDRTFWHETLHHINEVYCNRTIEEGDIDALAAGLHQVMNFLGVKFEW